MLASDVIACRGQFVIAINNAVVLAPWADVLIGGELKWWRWNAGCPGFAGEKMSLHSEVQKVYPDVQYVRPTGVDGFEWEPGQARTGGNSGYVAIQIAAQRKADRIILLGYDMQPSTERSHHFHGEHPDGSHPNYTLCAPRFATLVDPLAQRGIEIVNCSRQTALRMFPCLSLHEALTRPLLKSSSSPN